ncbi:MAG: DUF3999 domain-containing protein [Gammaproteobacteria bacterium]|nr:DUF3999 domain-containing protein [Gammaproteobacteria bacterium]
MYLKSLLALLLPATLAFAEPMPEQFAQGIILRSSDDKAVLEFTLPDSVYATVTRADLGDLRIFNADNDIVTHGFCAADARTEDRFERLPLPIFTLAESSATVDASPRISIAADEAGQVAIEVGPEQVGASNESYVLDASYEDPELVAVDLDWIASESVGEVHMRVSASDDLNQWRTVVADSTLLYAQGRDAALQQQRIALPPAHYRYLRITALSPAPGFELRAATASQRISGEVVTPTWFEPVSTSRTDDGGVEFSYARNIAVSHLGLEFPSPNQRLNLRLESRVDVEQPWRTRWTGEVYTLEVNGETQTNLPIAFDATADRFWRLQPATGSLPVAAGIQIEFGYLPARVRFLAQPPGPYLLAFGSAQAAASNAPDCRQLIASYDGINDVLGIAAADNATTSLGGDAALQPAPPDVPLRRIILWAVLVAGVLVVGKLALSALKDTQH